VKNPLSLNIIDRWSNTKLEREVMAKRKSLSRKIRFEVFKRDKFACQYCGKTAPTVVLQVDHIEPVAKGGTNDLMNLITSCWDCNSGKSDRQLGDDSVVEKQRRQMELLQDRREQIEQIFEWQKSLNQIQDDTISMLIEYVEELIPPYTINESGQKRFTKLLKQFDLADVLEAVDLSATKYLHHDANGDCTHESVEDFIKKIGGIAFNKNRPELQQKISYIKGICRNRFSYWEPRQGSAIFERYVSALREHGWDEQQIMQDLEEEVQPKTLECRHWTDWRGFMEQWTEDIRNWDKENEIEGTGEQVTVNVSSTFQAMLDQPDSSDSQTEMNSEEFEHWANDLFQNRSNAIDAIEYIGRAFTDFNNEELEQDVDAAIIQFLHILADNIAAGDEDELIPEPFRYATPLQLRFTPINSMLKLWLREAIDGILRGIIADFYEYEDYGLDPTALRKIADHYNVLASKNVVAL